MKKITLIAIGLFSVLLINAQNKGLIYSQDFENDYSDWTISAGSGVTTWQIGLDGSSLYWNIPEHTTYAYANDDIENGDMSDAWLISPTLNLSETVFPKLSVEYINDLTYGGVCTIKISTDNGTSWINLSTLASQNSWTTQEFSLLDYKSDSVKIAFHFDDEGGSVNGFAVDDIKIMNIMSHDLAINEVIPSYGFKNQAITPAVTISNYGQNSESSYNVSIVIKDFSDSIVYDHNKNFSNIIPSEGEFTAELDEDWTPPENGIYEVSATITVENDDDTTNNSVTNNFMVGYKPATIYTYSEQDNRSGMIPISCGEFTSLQYRGGTSYWFLSCADMVNGKLYAIENGSKKVYLIPPNGKIEHVGTITDGSIGNVIGLTYDAVNDVVYICDRQSSSSNLYTLNMNNWTVSSIGQISTNTIIAIAADANGDLYGIDNEEDKLISIDKTTGVGTDIGAMGIDVGWADLGCDRVNNVMYATTYNSTFYGKIGTVNTETGAFTDLFSSAKNLTTCAVSGGDLTEHTVEFNVYDGDSIPASNAIIKVETTCGEEILVTDNNGMTSISLINDSYFYSVNYNGCDDYEGKFSVADNNVTEIVNLSCATDVSNQTETNITVYPNPTRGIFVVESENLKDANIEISDFTGKIIRQLSACDNRISIDLSNQPQGIYLVKIITENKIITKKIIKNQ